MREKFKRKAQLFDEFETLSSCRVKRDYDGRRSLQLCYHIRIANEKALLATFYNC